MPGPRIFQIVIKKDLTNSEHAHQVSLFAYLLLAWIKTFIAGIAQLLNLTILKKVAYVTFYYMKPKVHCRYIFV